MILSKKGLPWGQKFVFLLGYSPKFGALLLSIPGPVIGGLSIVLCGLIAAMAGRIWVEKRVDLSNQRNLITVAAALTAGAGDRTLTVNLYHILTWNNAKAPRGQPALPASGIAHLCGRPSPHALMVSVAELALVAALRCS